MKESIEILNSRLFSSLDGNYPVSLFHGKMGLCICFYHLSRFEDNPGYKVIAEKLLEDVLGNLSLNHPIDVEDGLAGIGLGVTCLIKSGFTEGDINELLEDIDSLIFKKMAFNGDRYSNTELLHLLFYLYFRLTEQTDNNGRFLFEELIIKTVNLFYANLKEDFFNEAGSFSVYSYAAPPFLWIMGKLLSAGFYNGRLLKIIEELKPVLLYRLPILHANRLYLLAGLLAIKPHLSDPRWDGYAQLLHQETSITEIIEKEMKGRHVFISNGLSMIYILLLHIGKQYPEYRIAFDPEAFHERLTRSDAWNVLREKEYYYDIHRGLVNGFPGVQLVVSHIEKNRL